MAGLLYKENKVPHYQRFYQKDDGIRLWMKNPRSKVLMYPFFVMLSVGAVGSLYGMGRLVAGKKTFY